MFWKVEYFVRDFYKKFGPFHSVLDVGSRDINGTVRQAIQNSGVLFPEKFLGIDMIEGPGVDIVMNAHDLLSSPSPIRSQFELITCCETLEHDSCFWVTVENMRSLIKPGGWLLITTPSINFFRHDFPNDYYRFTDSVYKEVFFEGFTDVHVETYEDQNDPNKEKPNNTVLGYGRKP